MAISKQSKPCNSPDGQGQPPNDNTLQYASDLFEFAERMFELNNLTDASISFRISQHEIVKVTIALSDNFEMPKRRKRVRSVAEPIRPVLAMPALESGTSQWPNRLTKIFKKQFSRLLRYSVIDHGEWTFILVSGKVRWIVPAPKIMNKNDEIALLASFFSCGERPA
jgi:hypothetical protein